VEQTARVTSASAPDRNEVPTLIRARVGRRERRVRRGSSLVGMNNGAAANSPAALTNRAVSRGCFLTSGPV
jgi:hypothetical protein